MALPQNANCRIEMLGGLRVLSNDRVITRFQTQKAASLLAFLAYYPSKAHAREVLVEMLWPGGDPKAGRNSLSVALNSLRRQLEPPGIPNGSILCADYFRVTLNGESVSTDVTDFLDALREAREADDPSSRAKHLEAAIRLYQGELLSGYYEDWIVRESVRLDELFERAGRQLSLLRPDANQVPDPVSIASNEATKQRPRALPMQFTRFFGREEELERLRQIVIGGTDHSSNSQGTATRLVTLTGAAGTGKTRLAMECAARMSDIFGDSVWFTDLSGVTDAWSVPQAVHASLGLPGAKEGVPFERVVAALSKRSSLLVLDNFEHLLTEDGSDHAGGAAFVADLLRKLTTWPASSRLGAGCVWSASASSQCLLFGCRNAENRGWLSWP